MKLTATITASLAALLVAGCTKTGSSPSSAGTSASDSTNIFPKYAALVTTDAKYKLAFKSEQTGISYYIRQLTKDEVSKTPDEFVINGKNGSLMFVPIKNKTIVDAPLTDRVALAYKIPPEMLK